MMRRGFLAQKLLENSPTAAQNLGALVTEAAANAQLIGSEALTGHVAGEKSRLSFCLSLLMSTSSVYVSGVVWCGVCMVVRRGRREI